MTFSEHQQAIFDEDSPALEGFGAERASNPLLWLGWLFVAAASVGALLETQDDD